MTKKPNDLSRRIDAEIVDSFDEELEMEIDDDRLAKVLDGLAEQSGAGDRRPPVSISRSCSGCSANW